MNVSVYHEPHAPGVGGAEVVTAVLAASLARTHRVTLFHHREWFTRDAWAAFADADLAHVDVRYTPAPAQPWHDAGGPPWRFAAELREWQASLSRGFDLFLSSTHGVPPFNHAPRGALYIHFPKEQYGVGWPWVGPGGLVAGAKSRLRRWLHERAWPTRFAGYQLALANSQFTADWTRANWRIGCKVLHPPVRIDGFPIAAKTNRIVSLGRFDPMKRHLDLVRAFAARADGPLRGWELVCLGHLSDSPKERDYFAALQSAATGCAVRFVPNPPLDELRRTLAEARVFWHAAGLGEPPPPPDRQEHFGIATVEAMAAGCVPFVPNRGGQPEIVRNGIDGFVGTTADELANRTVELLADEAAFARMAASARARAAEFGRDRFERALDAHLAALTTAPAREVA